MQRRTKSQEQGVVNRILAGLIVVVLAAMGYVAYSGFLVEKPQPVAKVVKMKGSADVSRAAETVSLQRDSLLYAADNITVVKGRVRLQFEDGTVVILGDKTRLSLDNYDYDPETQIVSGSFGFLKGAMRLVTGRVKMARNLRVADRSGTTIGIRGTDVFIGNLEPKVLDVLLVESAKSVSVRNKLGTTKLTNGEGATVAKDAAPTAAKLWPQAKVDKALALVAE